MCSVCGVHILYQGGARLGCREQRRLGMEALVENVDFHNFKKFDMVK